MKNARARRLLRGLKRRLLQISKPDVIELLRRESAARPHRRVRNFLSQQKRLLKSGIGLYGLFTAEIGIGQGGRRLARALQVAKVPLSLHNIALPQLFESAVEFATSPEVLSPYDTIVIHLNPDTTCDVIQGFRPEALLGRRRIGYWLWELPLFPPQWVRALELVHEVWVPSRFVAGAVAAVTQKPVRIVPYPIPVLELSQADARSSLALSDGPFLFLSVFDLNSHLARKNPLASIRAFLDAFPRGKSRSVAMVVKCHGRNRGADFAELVRLVESDDRLILIDQVFSAERVTLLQAACDAYISLHRSEGFGFNIAECMALGKIVIATDFSANTDFTTPQNSLPVPYHMRAVANGEYPYGHGQWWAEPNHDAAVEAMRRAIDAPVSLGEQARADMRRLFSEERTGQIARAAWLGKLPPFQD